VGAADELDREREAVVGESGRHRRGGPARRVQSTLKGTQPEARGDLALGALQARE
jgi:hypothetical protein